MGNTLKAVLFAFIAAGVPAVAGDGVIVIDQTRAIGGGATRGDAPGFPVTISTNGSFRLDGNLFVPDENTTAILITGSANAVTIDLNGFAIIGPVFCGFVINEPDFPAACSDLADDPSVSGAGIGIRSLAADTLTVKNGTIRGMGRFALFQTAGAYVIVENVHARENGRGGLWPSSGLVVNSTVTKNGGDGIVIDAGVIKGTIVARNGGDGITSTGLPISVLDSQVTGNGGFGVDFRTGGLISNTLLHSNLRGQVGGSPVEGTNNYCNGIGCPRDLVRGGIRPDGSR